MDNGNQDTVGTVARRAATAVVLAGLVTAGAALVTPAAGAATPGQQGGTVLVNVTPTGDTGNGCPWGTPRNPCCLPV